MGLTSLFIASFLLCSIGFGFSVEAELSLHGKFSHEVQSIIHNPIGSQIIIKLHPSRKCSNPTYLVRISGTNLLIAGLREVETNTLIYKHSLLVDEGTYFVEVLALLCASFEPEDLKRMCIEEPTEGNVVNLPYSFHVAANETSPKKYPRWILPDQYKASALPTRYQKTNCGAYQNEWCPSGPSDISQHNLYEWTGRPDLPKLVEEVLQLSHNDTKNKKATTEERTTINVCLVGDSHAYMLVLHGLKLRIKGVEFFDVLSHFPEEFKVTWLEEYHCSYAIVTYGQWPASFATDGQPHTRSVYYEEMSRVMKLLQNYDHNQTQVFVRSENYNPLGARILACPPIDFRSPLTIDMYNSVLKQLSKELGVEYIDLNQIMGPMWDSALDWCHPEGKVATAEVEWILAHVLKSSLHHKQGVSLFKHQKQCFGPIGPKKC